MNSKLINFAALVSLADAGWNLGWDCPNVPKMENFNKRDFGGRWYEIFRDIDHDIWSDQECTEDFYNPNLFDMTLTRIYKIKSWFFDWNGNDGPKKIKPKWLFTPEKYKDIDYIDHGILEGKYQHYVIDSDYDNWAIVYGCDVYFGIFHGYYATLLSREPFMDYQHVRAAKDKLDEIGYDYGTLWVKPGLRCGFDAAKTLDEIMIDLLNT